MRNCSRGHCLKVGFIVPYALLFLVFFGLQTKNTFAQNSDKEKVHLISLDYSYISQNTQIQLVYNRDVLRLDVPNENRTVVFSSFIAAGTGAGPPGTPSYLFLALGVMPGYQFYKKHRVELGYQFNRSSTEYIPSLTVTKYPFTESSIRLKFGYRFEDNIMTVKLFTYPRFFNFTGRMFVEKGFGVGFRF